MKYEITVPPMGESITEATVGTLLKKEGDVVQQDGELLELETDKLNQVVFASHAGKVSYKVKSGDKVAVGSVIATIEESSEKPAAKIATQPSIQPSTPQVDPIKKVEEPPAQDENKPRESRKNVSKIRQVIAERLVAAQHQMAMLTTFNEVDLTQVILLKDRYKELYLKEHQVKLGYMSFFVKAAVSALEAFPEVNSYLDGDELVSRHYYDIGVAVSTEKGLIVPVLRSADKLTFFQIEQQIDKFSEKAKKGTLGLDDLQGGSFTITNGGVFGSLLSTPIINPPQVAILGMHKIVKRPVAINDQVMIRPMMYLALTYDHRILDGREAVSFLVHIKQCLEDPARIMLEI